MGDMKLKILILAFLVALAIGVSHASTTYSDVIFNSTTCIMNDSYLASATPNTNYGSQATFQINRDDSSRAIIYFNLSSIPSDSNVTSSVMNLWQSTGAFAGQLDLRRVINYQWTETGVTWNNATATQAWGTAGGDVDPFIWSSYASLATNGVWDPFTVTSLTQNWVNGSLPNYGVRLKVNTSAGNSLKIFNSKEGTTVPYMNITYIYNNPPNVTRISQTPADLTSTNAIAVNMNLSYNMTDDAGINASTVYLLYKVNSSTSNTVNFLNGTSLTGFFNTTGTNASNIWNFTLSDDSVYPGTYNFNETYMEQTAHSTNYTLNSDASLLKIRLHNVSSTKPYNIFEIMINNTDITGTQSLRVYYCNSTYTTGNPFNNSNCAQFSSLPAQTPYNHTHSFSGHQLISMAVNATSGQIAGVTVTGDSYFIVRGRAGTSAWQTFGISNITRTDQVQTSTDTGATYSNFAGTIDAHLHQYDGTCTLYYQACANDTDIPSKQTCGLLRTDLINLTALPPNSAKVTAPLTGFYKQNITINYTSSLSPTGNDIAVYNISLVNATNQTQFITTIASNNYPNLGYVWNSSAYNGQYMFRVQTCDNQSLCTFGYSQNITIDNILPAISIVTPTSVIKNNRTQLLNISSSDINPDTVWYNWNGTNYTYTTPIYITFAEGPNTLTAWANDTAGNVNTTSVTFTTDTINPTITINRPANTSYNNRTQLLNMTAVDTNLDKMWYNWNGTNYTYTTPINITFLEGSNTILAYVNDTAGNSGSSNVTFFTDTIAPTTTPSAGTYTFGTLTNGSVTVILTCNDGTGVGCNTTLYCNDTSNACVPNVVYSAPFVISTEGTSYIRFFSNDSVGNIESTGNRTIMIDTTPPQIAIESPDNATLYNSYALPISFNVTTNEVVSSCKYSLDGASNTTMTNDFGNHWYNSSVVDTGGEHNVTFYCNDTVDNKNSNFTNFFVDATAPEIDMIVPANNSVLTVTTTLINITTVDISNVTSCNYSYDGGANTTMTKNGYNFSAPKITTLNGNHNLSYYCVDRFGNLGSNVSHYLVNDTTVNATPTSPTNGTAYYSSPILLRVNASEQLVSVNATITGNMVTINYTLTETTPNIWTYNFYPTTETGYSIYYTITDVSGNLLKTNTTTFSRQNSGGGGGGGYPGVSAPPINYTNVTNVTLPPPPFSITGMIPNLGGLEFNNMIGLAVLAIFIIVMIAVGFSTGGRRRYY